MRRVGLFGGAFDPPTLAHLRIAESLIERDHLDCVWFVPCYKSLHGKNMTEAKHRSQMLMQLVSFSDMFYELHVCNYEIYKQLSGKTYDFLSSFLSEYTSDIRYDDYKFYFIMGIDNALYIKEFADWDKVIEMIPIIVIPRCGYDPCVDIKKFWFSKDPHRLMTHPRTDISSTVVRRILYNMENEGLPKGFFNSLCSMEVFRYIMSNFLYTEEYY